MIARSFALTVVLFGAVVSASDFAMNWAEASPRDEIRPDFETMDDGTLVISADHREGLSGRFQSIIEVNGGQYYRFQAMRRTEGVKLERRVAPARVIWQSEDGKPVLRSEPTFASYRPGERPRAEPEFANATGDVVDGWAHIEGVFLAPPDAKRAVIELHFRWGPPRSSVRWRDVSFEPVDSPTKKIVRLAAVHYRPREGKTAMEKCEQFAPLIAQAAEQKADLVVLPETLTYYGSGFDYVDAAEPIPGPSTQYFAGLAKQHDLYVVAGLLERDGHLVYNVAVLIGPNGEIVGKYRKVCLPRSEIEGGITPGNDYPVFDTRFGKVGMMVCYDGFFPEVARGLSNRGADVIAWPVWGCNPLLAQARACENHVFVVSSTYTDIENDWMVSAVFGRDGKPLSVARQWGTVTIAEVDLATPLRWHSLGDFRAQLPAHRPAPVE